MPTLANAKQEKYAKQRASGLIPSKAAVAAGYMPGSAIATNLERDPDVQARIEELHGERVEHREAAAAATRRAAEVVGEITGVSHSWVIRELVSLVADARGDGDYKEANAALKLIGEHLGMWGKGSPDEATADQTAHSLAEKALERMEKLSDGLAHLDAPTEMKALPDERALQQLVGHQIGSQRAKAVEVLTGTEADVALHPRSEPTQAEIDSYDAPPTQMDTYGVDDAA